MRRVSVSRVQGTQRSGIGNPIELSTCRHAAASGNGPGLNYRGLLQRCLVVVATPAVCAKNLRIEIALVVSSKPGPLTFNHIVRTAIAAVTAHAGTPSHSAWHFAAGRIAT